ncbi:MAG: hypothetical protein AAGH76_12845 [Pseudomonadota bacterium]
MRILFLFLTLLHSGSVFGQSPSPTPVNTWSPKANSRWVFHDPSDRYSARATAAVTGPAYNVFDHDAAVIDLAKDMNLVLARAMPLVSIPAWRRLNGSDLRAGLVNTTIDGRQAIVFMTVKQPKGSDQFELYAIAMPTQTYQTWGGIVWIMVDAGLAPSVDVFSDARRQQIASAPFAQQLELFTKSADLKVEILAKQLNAQLTQQMLINQMLDLNLDLMFGDLAVSPVR